MKKPNFDKIWKAKVDYYGNTMAAFEFAQDEFSRQLVSYYEEINRQVLVYGFYVTNKKDTLLDPATVKIDSISKWVPIDNG